MNVLSFNTVICSDNALFREGLVRILSEVGANIVLSNQFFPDNAPDLSRDESRVLLIVDASDDFDAAITQFKRFKLNYPNAKGTVLVGRHQLQLAQMISAFRSGVSAFLTNFMTPDAFVKSLELVMLGQTIFPLAMLTNLDQECDCLHRGTDDQWDSHGMNKNNNEHHQEENGCSQENDAIKEASRYRDGDYAPHFSTQEAAILRCLLDGHSNKAIARKMNISDATVKVHVKTILRKIRVENRTQAALWAMRNSTLISSTHNGESMTNKFRSDVNPVRQSAKLEDSEFLFRAPLSSSLGLREKEICNS